MLSKPNLWRDAFLGACKPKSRLTGSEWADQYRYVAAGTSPEVGPWRTSRVPYLKEPMDVCTDSDTQKIVMMMSSQVGKSELLINIMSYYIDQEPSPQLMIQPTLENAEAFSKERIDPTIKASKVLRDKIEDAPQETKGKRTQSTVRMKHFAGGYLALVGANAPAGLASRPIRIVLADELDRWGFTKEGSPLKLAIQRTENFHNKKIAMVSTPNTVQNSLIYDNYQESDKRIYKVPCQNCGSVQQLIWAQVKYDKNEDGKRLPMSARYECIDCGGVMRGAGRVDVDLIAAGHWEKQNPESNIAGFHINALYSPWTKLSDLVSDWDEIHKKNDKQGLREFYNLKLGLPFDDDGDTDALDFKDLYAKRREFYGAELPDQALVLTAGVDVQDTYLAAEVVAWAHDYESWGIEYRIFMGDPDQAGVWNELDVWLSQPRRFAAGGSLPVMRVCVDSGGHYTQEVYAFTKAREGRGFYSIKGRGGEGIPFVGKPTKAGKVAAHLFVLGTNNGKDKTMARINAQKIGAGYCHFPREDGRGYDEAYFQGLLSEKKRYKTVKGQRVVEWVKTYARNEPFDVRNYATAAVEIMQPNFDYLEQHIDRTAGLRPPRAAKRRGNVSKGVVL